MNIEDKIKHEQHKITINGLWSVGILAFASIEAIACMILLPENSPITRPVTLAAAGVALISALKVNINVDKAEMLKRLM